MATTTSTGTAAASGAQPRTVHAGSNAVTFEYNSTTKSLSGASVVLLGKIPHGVTVTDLVSYHTTGAATCPMDISLAGTLLLTGVTQGAVTRAATGLPFTVSVSDDATARYEYLKAETTAGTSTGSVKISVTVYYTRNPA